MNYSLILLDTDKVKDYVFATNNLKEVRGASSLLEHLNKYETKSRLKGVTSEEYIIYCGGGSAMAVVPEDKAEATIQTIQRLYYEQTTNASISGIALPLPDNYETMFGKLAFLAGQKLRQFKDGFLPVLQLPLAPWFRDCDSCGRYPAEFHDNSDFLCRSCQKKSQSSQRSVFFEEFCKKLGQKNTWKAWEHLPEGFTEIGQVSTPSDYIGFIYADGNGMGEILKTLDSPQSYKNFSTSVDELTREVTYQALHSYANRPRPLGHKEIAPFEILLVGGDDLMLVTAADLALPVAIKIAQDFETRSEEKTGKKLSLSVGVVLAHASYPIAAMSDLAEALLKSAKKRSSQQRLAPSVHSPLESSLDFMVVTAASSRELEWVRDEILTEKGFIYPSSERNCHLTQRPYLVNDFAELYDTVGHFHQENFPGSQLQALYDNLFVSFNMASLTTVTALARLKQKHRKVLQSFLEAEAFKLNQPPPWRRLDGNANYSTALGDLIEMYRFVTIPRSKNANGNSND